ncbi:MAG: hypothetical protein JWQ19_1837 [Subtercola sp.]|nr:hypothetical protein [Subtercola sp.]
MRHDPRAAAAVGDHIYTVNTEEALVERRRVLHRGYRQRQVAHSDYSVRPSRVRPDNARLVHMQVHAGAPAQPVSLVITFDRLDRDLKSRVVVAEVREAPQRIDDHLAFELALPGQRDVPELGAARPGIGLSVQARRLPDVLTPVL